MPKTSPIKVVDNQYYDGETRKARLDARKDLWVVFQQHIDTDTDQE
jgi:hypothetical protein